MVAHATPQSCSSNSKGSTVSFANERVMAAAVLSQGETAAVAYVRAHRPCVARRRRRAWTCAATYVNGPCNNPIRLAQSNSRGKSSLS